MWGRRSVAGQGGRGAELQFICCAACEMLWQRLRDMLIMAAAANVSAARLGCGCGHSRSPSICPPASRVDCWWEGEAVHVTQWQDINVKQLPLVQYSRKSRQTDRQRSRKNAVNFLERLEWKIRAVKLVWKCSKERLKAGRI